MCVCVCVCVCCGGACGRLLHKNKKLSHHAGNRVVFVGISQNKPLCFISTSFLTPSSLSLVPPPETSSHHKYRAVSNEEERKEVLVQSEMQMATEDMSTSQFGTRPTFTRQFLNNKSNVTP